MAKFIVKADLSAKMFRALADIHQYNEATQQELRRIVHDKTQEVYETAVHNAPYRTGKLRASIRMDVEGAMGTVYTNYPIAHLIEYGAKGAVVVPIRRKALHPGADGWFMAKAVIPYRSAKPFLKPAMDKVRPSIESAIKEAITKHAKT